MSFVSGSNSDFSSSIFFFSSSSSISKPSLVVDLSFFHELCERLKLRLQLLHFFLLVLVVNFQALFGGRFELLSIELLQLLNGILIDRVHHIQDLQTLLSKALQEGRGGDSSNTLTSDVVNVILPFLHAIDVLFKADLLIARFRAVVAHELCHLGAICRILMHTKFEALAKLLIELLVIVFFLSNLCEHLQALLH